MFIMTQLKNYIQGRMWG